MIKSCPLTVFKEQRGLNRRQLSNKTGLGYETLSRIERGQHVNLSSEVAEKLGKFFNTDATALQEDYTQWKESLVENE